MAVSKSVCWGRKGGTRNWWEPRTVVQKCAGIAKACFRKISKGGKGYQEEKAFLSPPLLDSYRASYQSS